MQIRTLKYIVSTILVFILGAILTWAPWLNNQKILEDTYKARASIDGTAAADCDYEVVVFPFGREVGSCEGSYFVTFWGQRI